MEQVRDAGHLRVAIQVDPPRDRDHLAQVIRLAQRTAGLPVDLCDPAEADVVIVRRGEPGLLLTPADELALRRPVPVVYSSSPRETHPWRLRDPARTADLVPVFRALQDALQRLPARPRREAADATAASR